MRRPPRVSSIFDIRSPHCCWPSSDLRFNRLPTRPITMPANGSNTSTNNVNCHDIAIIVDRQTTIIIGFLNIMSREAITEFSTSATSPLMRAITSPLRSDVKNEIGNFTTLSYIKLRISRTIPDRRGTI